MLIQAIGSAATLGAAAFVAWRFGLAAQGEFGLLRSWSDALVALAALGLPQGLLHLQYHEGATARSLRPFIRGHLALLAVLAVPALLAIAFAHLSDAAAAHRVQVGIVVAAVPFGVGHLLWRALVLKAQGVVRYSVVTGLPSVLVFAGVLALAALDTPKGFAVVIFIAAAVACVVSAIWSTPQGAADAPASPAPSTSSATPAWPRRVLWSVSLQTWVQGALAALLVALLLSLARAFGAPLSEVGVVSLGLYVYQLFGVLATYAAPVVYDRVAGAPAGAARFATLGRWRARAVAVAFVAFVAALVGPRAVALAWPTSAVHADSVTLFAVAGLSALGTRLGATLLQALGRLRELSMQAAWRLVAALAITTAAMQAMPASYAVPLALLAIEVATVVRLVALLRRDGVPPAPVATEEGAA